MLYIWQCRVYTKEAKRVSDDEHPETSVARSQYREKVDESWKKGECPPTVYGEQEEPHRS